jgi:hypothetical protein
MAEFKDREHFIPLHCGDLVEFLCTEKGPMAEQKVSVQDQRIFRSFAAKVMDHFHREYHDWLKRLKVDYIPFDPDSDLRTLVPLTPEQKEKRQESLFNEFSRLLERANYVHMTRPQIETTMAGSSLWGIDMDVDWNCFERLELFYRGEHVGHRTRKHWWKWWKKFDVTVPTFQRMVLIVKQKPHKRLGADADVEHIFMKMFKDIPKMDLEMIFPGTKIKMKMWDRGKLGASTAGTIGYVSYKIGSMFDVIVNAVTGAFTAAALVLYAPLMLVLGYAYKTWSGFQYTKKQYMFTLTQSLYYQNLDNNAGLLFRILDEAEEQESREAILGYFFLWRYAGERGWMQEELDDYIELELEKRLNLKIDFEIGDAIEKLVRLKLVQQVEGRYRAVPIESAIATLTRIYEETKQKAGG